MSDINWKVNREDARLIDRIIARLIPIVGPHPDVLINFAMDITATHLNGCPLDLERLLNAETADFAHDIIGIALHINRNNGKIERGFTPRSAKREKGLIA